MKRLLLALLLTTPTWSSDWRETNVEGANTQQIYIDYESFSPTKDGTYEAWVKWLLKLKNPKSLTETNYTLEKTEFNCSTKESRVKQLIAYNQKGEVVYSNSFPDFFRAVVPDTIGEGLLDYVCEIVYQVNKKSSCDSIAKLYNAGKANKWSVEHACGEIPE